LLATGVLIGMLAGLLGVGGGVVAVPILLDIFLFLGLNEQHSIALATGTAQANIVVASLSATYAHWKAGTIDRVLLRNWLPSLLIGSLFGLLLGAMAAPRLLTTIFAGVATALAFQLVAGDRLAFQPRTGTFARLPPVIVGGLASAVGVGGGTLSTPVLSLFSFPIKRAIGAGALFNFAVALPATAFFLVHDLGEPGRPIDALGDVSMVCLAALSLPALFTAPVAARWSTRAPTFILRQLVALCLALIALRLVLKA
jgi:uncharacterized membrane protein YfcA